MALAYKNPEMVGQMATVVITFQHSRASFEGLVESVENTTNVVGETTVSLRIAGLVSVEMHDDSDDEETEATNPLARL